MVDRLECGRSSVVDRGSNLVGRGSNRRVSKNHIGGVKG